MRIPAFVKSVSRFAQPAALVAALGLVVVLARQNRTLQTAVKQANVNSHIPRRGVVLPAFRGVTLKGDSIQVGRGSPQIMFFFTTICPYCRQSLQGWETLAAHGRVRGVPYKVVGVGLGADSAVRAYVREHAMLADVVEFPDSVLLQAYRVEGVPLTVVADSHGRVVLSRLGVVDTKTVVDSIVQVALIADSLTRVAPGNSSTRRS